MRIIARPTNLTEHAPDPMRGLVDAITDELCALYFADGRFDFAGAERHLAALTDLARHDARECPAPLAEERVPLVPMRRLGRVGRRSGAGGDVPGDRRQGPAPRQSMFP